MTSFPPLSRASVLGGTPRLPIPRSPLKGRGAAGTGDRSQPCGSVTSGPTGGPRVRFAGRGHHTLYQPGLGRAGSWLSDLLGLAVLVLFIGSALMIGGGA